MQSPTPDAPRDQAAAGGWIPLWRDVLADVETPLSAYWKLAHDEPYSFLLESVTGGEQVARYSVIGVRPREVRTVKGGVLRRESADGVAEEPLADGEDPLARAWEGLPWVRPEAAEGMPKFIGGAVGTVAYDYLRTIERLGEGPPDDAPVPTVAMMVTGSVVVFDHARNLMRLIVLADGSHEGAAAAEAELDRLAERLASERPPLPAGGYPEHPVEQNRTQADFEEAVRTVIEYIRAGDCIQAVPSVRFSTRIDAHPVTVYRALRSINPSPYMFLLRFGGFDVVGASPELLVSLGGGVARVRPIAGTRPRGATPAEDQALAEGLFADEKERAEHIMLVDLGRNDLGRVCEYGSVRVEDLMVVERYSHVMHIVSSVTGRLREGLGPVELVRACFPAGTVSGAPKVRAMQIIDELEPTRRGLYAGAVGYVSATGDVDLAIAIRTVVLREGVAYVQAGAGIVFDSVPESEYLECVNKARASLRALSTAQKGLSS